MSDALQGIVRGIAIKREHGAPMDLVEEVAVTEAGLDGNIAQSDLRRVTLISQEQWAETLDELGADLPWQTRRANILVGGIVRMGDLIAKTVTLGGVTLRINGETRPCSQMDGFREGLQLALRPEGRGGVYGSVVEGGAIRVGDRVGLAPS